MGRSLTLLPKHPVLNLKIRRLSHAVVLRGKSFQSCLEQGFASLALTTSCNLRKQTMSNVLSTLRRRTNGGGKTLTFERTRPPRLTKEIPKLPAQLRNLGSSRNYICSTSRTSRLSPRSRAPFANFQSLSLSRTRVDSKRLPGSLTRRCRAQICFPLRQFCVSSGDQEITN
jgi:hypothetical protein